MLCTVGRGTSTRAGQAMARGYFLLSLGSAKTVFSLSLARVSSRAHPTARAPDRQPTRARRVDYTA